jgi:hypothetical protein
VQLGPLANGLLIGENFAAAQAPSIPGSRRLAASRLALRVRSAHRIAIGKLRRCNAVGHVPKGAPWRAASLIGVSS